METAAWQLSGNNRELNTSVKSISNKILNVCLSQVEEMKNMQTESKAQQDNSALKTLASALAGTTEKASGPAAAHTPSYGQLGY